MLCFQVSWGSLDLNVARTRTMSLAEHAGTLMLRIRSTAAMAGLLPVLALAGPAGPAIARPAAPAGEAAAAHVRPAASVSRSAFRVAVSRHYGEPGNASGYSVVVVTGRREAWAFGGTNPGGPSTPVAERWNGRTMTPSALPAGLTGFITDASAPSATDIWAASEYGGYVLHLDGTRWRVAMRWPGETITGLTAVSADDVWVFGTTASGARQTGTWHFNGRSWRRVAGAAASIYRASAASRRDVWAIAATPRADSILRYRGRTWRPMPTGRVLAGVTLHDVLAISDRNVWVVGDETSAGTVRLVLAHWNGTRWRTVGTRVRAWAGRLAPGPHGSVLITATPADAAASGLILQAGANGWRRAITIQSGLGSGVSDVALLRRTRSLLASGGILTRLGGDAVLWSVPRAPVDRHRAEARADHQPDDA
jgi:hypothetical protein